MQDVRIAKQLQNQETSVFKEEEQRRRAVIAAQWVISLDDGGNVVSSID